MIAADHLVAGRYRLRHEIARGGMAEVWEAEDSVLGRAVAVKVLLPELAADPSFLERFRREAISAARLAHPNVVGIFDTGLDDGLAFIVMELVDGTTLRETLLERGALRRPRPSTSPPRWRGPSSTPTRPASSIATSSRPTSCCAGTGG